MPTDILPGKSYPLGATASSGGVNFSVFSKNCEALELLLFDDADAARPARVIPFDPHRHRTFYYWHLFVPGLLPEQLYGYRAYGPYAPAEGLHFDGDKVLLDPYARAVAIGSRYERDAAIHPGDNSAHALKGVVVDPATYDWEGDQPLGRPFERTVIYELHVGGFTRHPSSGVAPARRGTYAGLVEKISYLQQLGVTAVQLMPVQQFDAQDAPEGLTNYWGYSPIGFFAPHAGYSAQRTPLGVVDEFRDLVKALHRAGIEVILDVVFNHTAEGDHTGPTLSFRGLENRAYYILEEDPSRYANFSGCGNTINGNQSIVRRLIRECLRYWVVEMHVDGFRFDLASVLSRDERGRPIENPPILWEIESDPVLAGTKIIAEAWDAAGLYQVGSFIGDRWAELNGKYRDDVRRFVKSDPGTIPQLAARLTASPDLYPQPNRFPHRSINFITSHDGFTLNDLVSYNVKHNEANREDNRDGHAANFSWNCGVEGPTQDPAVEALRLRQIKNLLTILLVSQGTPMLLMGDEVRRTQYGNNNAYCQDNEVSWFDWRKVEQEAELLRFVRGLIGFSRTCEVFKQEHFWAVAAWDGQPPLLWQQLLREQLLTEGLEAAAGQHRSSRAALLHTQQARAADAMAQTTHVAWHGTRLWRPDTGFHSHTLAYELYHPAFDEHLHVMLNAYWKPLAFELPALPKPKHWHRIIDTALTAPADFSPLDAASPVKGASYRLEPRSAVVLMAAAER